jgi:hypothetical protein
VSAGEQSRLRLRLVIERGLCPTLPLPFTVWAVQSLPHWPTHCAHLSPASCANRRLISLDLCLLVFSNTLPVQYLQATSPSPAPSRCSTPHILLIMIS